MTDKLKLTNRLMNVRDRAKVFHSSGYARTQSGAGFGAASTESFGKRREIDENRKFVRKYNNARVINDARALERIREYIPRTGRSGSADMGAAVTEARAGAKPERYGAAQPLAQRATPGVQPPTRRVAPIRRGR